MRQLLERLLEWITLTLMSSLALVVVAGVVFRKAGQALVWYDEVASILLVWLTYYGSSLAILRKAHIGFSGLVRRLGPGGRLAALWLREFLLIGFFLVLGWSGWQVLAAVHGTYLISLPWVPSTLAHSVIPLGAGLMIAAELCSLPQSLQQTRVAGKETPS